MIILDTSPREYLCVHCGTAQRFHWNNIKSPVSQALSAGWDRVSRGWLCPICGAERKDQ